MKTEIKLWWIRNFKVINKAEALRIGLNPYGNIFGSKSYNLKCLSIWIDSKNREYRVNEYIIYDI